MNWRVLVSAPYMQLALDTYRPQFSEQGIELVVPPVRERLREDELLPWVTDVDGAICGDDQFTERVLRAARRLKVISKWGTGVDSIDREAARRLGIQVYSTPGAFTEPVADTVIGYVLCFARKLPWMDHGVRAGHWEKLPCVSLAECTLGVIGVGTIGRAVIRRAIAFEMRAMGYDIVKIPQEFRKETRLEVVSKDDLLRQADFISLNCDLNPTSYHLIGERELRLMKPTSVLINTARGPIVDEGALVRALHEGIIAGAALDVFEVEPLPPNSPLRTLDRVLLAPHNANGSARAWQRVHDNTIHNLLKGLQASAPPVRPNRDA